MVLGEASSKFRLKMLSVRLMASGPETLMTPMAPPAAVATAQMVSLLSMSIIYVFSNSFEDLLYQDVDGVIIIEFHVLGPSVGYYHATG